MFENIIHYKNNKCNLKNINKELIEQTVVLSVKEMFNDALIEEIVDRALTELRSEYNKDDEILKLENELKEIKSNIDKYTDLLIKVSEIDSLIIKIKELEIAKKELEQKIYLAKTHNIDFDREKIIRKIKKMRDFDFTQNRAVQMFIDAFVYRVYVNEDKKIAILLKLSDGLFFLEPFFKSDILGNEHDVHLGNPMVKNADIKVMNGCMLICIKCPISEPKVMIPQESSFYLPSNRIFGNGVKNTQKTSF